MNITHTQKLEGDASPTGFISLEELEKFIQTAYSSGWAPNSVVRAKRGSAGENFPITGLLLTKQNRSPDEGEKDDTLAPI